MESSSQLSNSADVFCIPAGKTPVLVLDLREVERNLTDLRVNFPGVEVWYAMKSNPHPSILELLTRLEVGFEVASPAEVRQLVAAGVPAARMMCLHPIKSPDFLRLLAEIGITVLAADSIPEIEKIARYTPHSRLLFRIEVAGGGSRVPLGGKFGCPPNEVLSLYTAAQNLGLRPAGITMHVGSQCESVETWSAAVRLCRTVSEQLADAGVPIEIMSLGGGLPARYHDQIPGLDQLRQVISAENLGPLVRAGCRVTIEPGRAVVASAGTLVASVVGTAVRSECRWAYLDAGIYHGLFELLPVAGGLPNRVDVEFPDRPVYPHRLAGPTCDSLDVLPETYELPELRLGDRIAFRCAGAYSGNMFCSFNGFEPPNVTIRSDCALE